MTKEVTMNRSRFAAALFSLLIPAAALSGCAVLEREGSGIISGTTKLNRRVVLYAANGDTIRTWVGEMYISDGNGAGIDFMYNGKRVSLSGTWTVEELK